MLVKVLILLSLHKCHAQLLEFGIDYYGEQISVDEYKNSSICLTYACLRDAKRIMSYAPHKYIPDPCKNFLEFTCGHFYEFGAPNDRYYKIGFINEIDRQYQHLKKLMLKKKIHKDEPKIFQIMKSFFQKCVNSTYVITEGKAEILKVLSEFGKFPAFEENWKPSDFNETKVLIHYKEYDDGYSIFTSNMIKDMLHFELDLSRDLITDILKDYKQFTDSNKIEHAPYRFTFNEGGLNETTTRQFANIFMVQFLMERVVFFSVYPQPRKEKRALNRYETCIEQIQYTMNFPLEVMFQIKYANKVNKTSLKEFFQKAILIESEVLIDHLEITNETLIEKIKDLIVNFPINIGYSDELTTPEFLNKLYANLNLTGEESVYQMYKELRDYEDLLQQKENYSIYLKNLSENAKYIFEECRVEKRNGTWTCRGQNNIFVFRFIYILYPLFHPDRPYFVNLAYNYNYIRYLFLSNSDLFHNELNSLNLNYEYLDDIQRHYLKYLELFGPEEKLPGFLMTNQQMISFIDYQTVCLKYQNGTVSTYYLKKGNIFNCPVKDEDEEYGWK